MSTRNFSYLSLSLIILLVAVIAYGTYLVAFDANPPVVYNNLPFPVDKAQYRAGEEIIITADYCKFTNVPFHAHVAFVDGLIFSVPEVSVIGGQMGCNTINTNVGAIPANLPPGRYYLSVKNEYRVNFMATRTVEWTTVEFDVVE